jgi:signal transduction histidine kinase
MIKILVIEDESDIREGVLEWLTFEGYEAIGAAHGQQGVELALQHVPDLILSDVSMPEMDGYRVLLELRTHPTTALIPFIFLTARAGRDDARYGMELGADDYITKPFTYNELLGAVTSRLHRSDMQQQHATEQMDELRRTLARTLPHELRTPLISIMGYGELLSMEAETLTPDRIKMMAEAILRGGKRLYALIENYLLYAYLEIEGAEPEKLAAYKTRYTDFPNQIVGAVCEQVAHSYQRTSDLKLDMRADRSVRVSELDLKKITHELVDNAFKFSSPQTPVHVTLCVQDERYCLRFSDHGRGMKSADISRIGAYTQFERGVYEQQGAGLGLIIAKRLSELYEGQLTIESIYGEGTTVTVTLLCL